MEANPGNLDGASWRSCRGRRDEAVDRHPVVLRTIARHSCPRVAQTEIAECLGAIREARWRSGIWTWCSASPVRPGPNVAADLAAALAAAPPTSRSTTSRIRSGIRACCRRGRRPRLADVESGAESSVGRVPDGGGIRWPPRRSQRSVRGSGAHIGPCRLRSVRGVELRVARL